MNYLQLVQAACNEMGIQSPSVVIGTTDQQITQIGALANAVGNMLISQYEWQKVCKEHTFELEQIETTGDVTSGSAVISGIPSTTGLAATTWGVSGNGIPAATNILTVDGATQVTMTYEATDSGSDIDLTFTKLQYDLPSDFSKQINRTHWDRTNHWELLGPKSPQEQEWLKGAIVSTGPRVRYWIQGNKFQIWPLQVSVANLVYQYISNSWIYASGGTAPTKSAFTVDTDTTIFRDRTMIAGIKYLFWQIKGFDTTAFEGQFRNEVEKEMAQDKGAPTLSLAPVYNSVLISPANVPDGNVYGQ